MFVKKLLRKILFNFFKLIIRISISRFDKKKYKNYIVSCPFVNTYGDPVHHVDYIRLLNFESKRQHLIICPDIYPSNVYLKFIIQNKMYRFYSEKIFLLYTYQWWFHLWSPTVEFCGISWLLDRRMSFLAGMAISLV